MTIWNLESLEFESLFDLLLRCQLIPLPRQIVVRLLIAGHRRLQHLQHLIIHFHYQPETEKIVWSDDRFHYIYSGLTTGPVVTKMYEPRTKNI